MKKYYDILGIETGATEAQVKKAYKKMALKVHPDSGGSNYLFQQVNEAYTKITKNIKKKKKSPKTKKNDDIGIYSQENNNNQFLSSPFDNDFFKNFDSNFDLDLDFPFKYSNSNIPLSAKVKSSYYSESIKSQYKNGKTITKKIINDNGKIYEQTINNKDSNSNN